MKQLTINIPEGKYQFFKEWVESLEYAKIVSEEDKKGKQKTAANKGVSYSPASITTNNRKYIFNFPLMSSFQKEDDHYVIKNELLDIYAVGESEQDAENDFKEEFDYLYQTLNSFNENEITERLKTIKTFINFFVKEVTSNGN